MLHIVSEEHVRLTVCKCVDKQVKRMLKRHHLIFVPVKDGRRTADSADCLEVVKAFLDQEIDYSAVLGTSNVSDRLDRAYQKKTRRIVQAREVTCWP